MKTVPRLRLVALVEWGKAVLVSFAVVGLLALGGDGLRRLGMALIDHFHLNPANHPARMLVYITDGASADLHWVIAIALAYVALRVAEGWGLWAGRAWAVVVGLVSVALYLPVELWHLWHSPDLPGLALLTINLLLLALL